MTAKSKTEGGPLQIVSTTIASALPLAGDDYRAGARSVVVLFRDAAHGEGRG